MLFIVGVILGLSGLEVLCRCMIGDAWDYAVRNYTQSLLCTAMNRILRCLSNSLVRFKLKLDIAFLNMNFRFVHDFLSTSRSSVFLDMVIRSARGVLREKSGCSLNLPTNHMLSHDCW